MARNRFVAADVARLELSDGDWIEVKTELNFAEAEALKVAGLSDQLDRDTNTLQVDWVKYAMARILAWVVEWSFRDTNDKPVEVTATTVATLSPATAKEIDEALDRHVASLEERGKVPSGEPAPEPVSP